MRFLCLNYTVLSAVSQVRFAILPIFHNQSAIYSYCQQAQNRKNKENRGFEIKKLLQPVRNERLQQLFSFFCKQQEIRTVSPSSRKPFPAARSRINPNAAEIAIRQVEYSIVNHAHRHAPPTRVCFYHTTIGAVLQWETRFFPFFRFAVVVIFPGCAHIVSQQPQVAVSDCARF